MRNHYIGLMSGTSLDGADGVLVDFSGDTLRVVASATEAFPAAFRAELLALNTSGPDELHRAAMAANQLAVLYARVVLSLVQQGATQGIAADRITAIGAHGQTVRHQPSLTSATASKAGYTLQLNNPALLAELTGLDVVADFRSRDVAAGGQGAPLAPAFHQGVFGQADATVCVLNLGGISNLSVLPPAGQGLVLGFDCGAGNALMDAWCQRHTGAAFDASGAWAASGRLLPGLLASLLDDAYFALPPPKSTGRDLFSLAWLEGKLAAFSGERPEDIQNTLAEFTVSPCVAAVSSYGKDSKRLVVCGGGAFNQHLMARLQAGLPLCRVESSDLHGLPPLQVEAAAFAWLARQTMQRLPGNLPGVTGAAGPRVLGAIYPA
ncbi:MAG: anhydro-N-acetylmuramic acid kinase [Pseudomonadota bacterium]|uniref:anhydro-N-acetylmuramic acid kinase n=1 Tax=Polaromonas sp. TaxID=1869339 RepID=UPI0018384095|nr:anhydro-N-acetylmuramic acid kinase [Polaromonas sp.]MBA3595453.1 anhydro-N-acetylmuramic acid kinase [Polaromonas sp.]MDQ3272411.1 anhydro-N-acetylmuramic acid kinase [Pseudomonadota bacterium]